MQKNFTSAELMLRRSQTSSKPAYDVTDGAQRRNKLLSRSFVDERHRQSLHETHHDVTAQTLASRSFQRPRVVRTGEQRVRTSNPDQHVDVTSLCVHLQSRGLGDPRSLLPPNPRSRREEERKVTSLLRKRARQQRKFAFYIEKLRGCAKVESDVINSRAEAFIAQQVGDGTTRDRKKFRYVLFGNERNADDRVSDRCSSVGDVTDDGVDESERFKRISDWIKTVNEATKSENKKQQSNDL